MTRVQEAKQLLEKYGYVVEKVERSFDHSAIDASDYSSKAKNCLNKAWNEVIGLKPSKVTDRSFRDTISLECEFNAHNAPFIEGLKTEDIEKLEKAFADELEFRLPKECKTAYKGMEITSNHIRDGVEFCVKFRA